MTVARLSPNLEKSLRSKSNNETLSATVQQGLPLPTPELSASINPTLDSSLLYTFRVAKNTIYNLSEVLEGLEGLEGPLPPLLGFYVGW